MTLDEKIDLALGRIQGLFRGFGPGRVAVAWTGGKDSTVVLDLVRRHMAGEPALQGAVVRAVNLDTGVKFPEVLAFRDRMVREWGVALHVFTPEVTIQGYPLAEDSVSCCRDLKIEPLKRAVAGLGIRALVSGVRADEHPDRAGRQWKEHRTDPDHVLAHPILEWSEMDVWSYHMQQGLPYCSLYDQGYRSLGCMPCTELPAGQEERSGRSQAKERSMEQLRSLGYF